MNRTSKLVAGTIGLLIVATLGFAAPANAAIPAPWQITDEGPVDTTFVPFSARAPHVQGNR